MSPPSLIAFGPQIELPSPDQLSQIRSFVLDEPLLAPLSESIDLLPALLGQVVENTPDLDPTSALESIERIRQWVLQGTQLPLDGNPPNTLLTPLTVIIHIAQYLRYLRCSDFDLDHASVLEIVKDAGFQGFCVGFLAAAAVSSSCNEKEIGQKSAVALSLAFFIGVFIDADRHHAGTSNQISCVSVRCKKDVNRQEIMALVNDTDDAYTSVIYDDVTLTVTAAESAIADLLRKFARRGYTVKPVPLTGRFHSQVHAKAVEKLLDMCKRNESLRFGDADQIRVPLRSNTTGEIIKDGLLHERVLNGIMRETCDWHLTLERSLSSLSATDKTALMIGTTDFISPSISRKFCLRASNLRSEEGFSPRSDSVLQSKSQEFDPANHYPKHAIAVVGMACKFPGADSVNEFWDIIKSGLSLTEELRNERFETSNLRRNEGEKIKYWGNFIKDIDAFDHKFFNMSSREAASTDPQQRLLLEVAYQAMQDSGQLANTLSESPFSKEIGCFIGCGAADYNDNVASHPPTSYSALGTLRAFLSGRISHHFGWTGPSITYDTACSSSMVAIHSACKSLELGECSAALAGGVNVITSPNLYQNLQAASLLSKTGPTKAFDAAADGYCRGEGVGLVVLKRLDDALKNSDTILGVITGSAVNQNSNLNSITVPDSDSQVKLFKKALSFSGLSPTDVSVVEAHGTGTQLGDPAEYRSIRTVFEGASRKNSLYLGSVKSNIGHTEGAAGVAGLIKVLLMLRHGTIPPQANFSSANPRLEKSNSDAIIIPRTCSQWTSPLLAACVNNYGAAGSNAAIVVQQAPQGQKKDSGNKGAVLTSVPILLTASTESGLKAYMQALRQMVDKLLANSQQTESVLESLGHTLSLKQDRSLSCSFTAVVSSLEDFRNRLSANVSGTQSQFPTGRSTSQRPIARKPVILAFSGQSTTSVRVNQEFFHSSRLFRSYILECDGIIRSLGFDSIFPGITKEESSQDIVAYQCSLFAVQYSTAKTWMASGMQIQAMIGHSFGQLTALCVAGAFSLRDGLRLVAGRAALIQEHCKSDPGSMVAIEGALDITQRLVDTVNLKAEGSLEIACYNGPTSYVLAGTTASVTMVEEIAKEDAKQFGSLKLKRLDVVCGFHSPVMEPILDRFEALAQSIEYHRPTIYLETCSENRSWVDVEPRHIVDHTRKPVYFGEAVDRLTSRFGECIWVEAGLNSPVISMVRHALGRQASAHDFLSLKVKVSDPWKSLAENVVSLWKADHLVDFWPFHRSDQQYQLMELPPYQFEKSRHWLDYIDKHEHPQASEAPVDQPEASYLSFLGFQGQESHTAEFAVDLRHERCQLLIKGHAVIGVPLCPASLYVDLATKSAIFLLEKKITESANSYTPCMEDLQIHAPLGNDVDQKIIVSLIGQEMQTSCWQFEISSQTSHGCQKHATGSVSLQSPEDITSSKALQSLERLVDDQHYRHLLESEDTESLQGAVIYSLFSRTVNYAKYYRGVKTVRSLGREAVGQVQLPQHNIPDLDQTICNPLEIDNFLQVAGIHVNCLNGDELEDQVYVATEISKINFNQNYIQNGSSSRPWVVYTKYQEMSQKELVNDIFIFDRDDNKLAVTLLGVCFTKVPISSLLKALRRANASHEERSTPNNRADKLKKKTSAEKIKNSQLEDNQDLSGDDDKQNQVKNLLSDVLDIPVEALNSETTFDELGIDSLMVSEILSEIRRAFDTTISVSDFQALRDVQALCDHLSPNGASTISEASQCSSEYASTSSRSSSRPTSAPSSRDRSPVQRPSDKLDQSPNDTVIWNADEVQDSFNLVQSSFDVISEQTRFAHFWTNVYPKQARLVTVYTVDAFSNLGCPIASLRAGQKLSPIKVLPKHSQVLKCLYTVLEDAGLISKTVEGYVRTQKAVEQSSYKMLLGELLETFPQHNFEHKLLDITGSRLSECLAGKADAVQLLFGTPETRELLKDVYMSAPMFKAATLLLRNFLVKALRNYTHDSKINILEIGAGTGGTTRFLLQSLVELGINFAYDFTDISPSLVAKARKDFSEYGSMNFMTLDVEKEVPSNLRKHYHVVISTNCIHATSNLSKSCTNIRSMIRDDGVLALVELTRNIPWFDLVFGLLDGWWMFKDGRKHALADEGRWNGVLRKAGFEHVDWTDTPSRESDTIRVILGFASRPTAPRERPRASSLLLQGKAEQSGRNVFLLPGGFGTASTYAPLPLLAEGLTLYGLNSPFLKIPEEYEDSLASFTARYISEMRRIQPRGPYTIMGYSVGGVIAYEAARQLIEGGDIVESLLLIDTACPLLVPPFPLSLLNFFDSIDRFTGGNAGEKPEKKNEAKPMTDPHVRATLRCLADYSPLAIPHEKAPRTVLFRARDGVDKQNRVKRPDVSSEEEKVLDWVLNDRDSEKVSVGWERLVGDDRLSVVHVDGNHFSVMTDPYVVQLANRIRKSLGV